MVDAADPEKIEASKNELHNLLDKPQLQGIPVLLILKSKSIQFENLYVQPTEKNSCTRTLLLIQVFGHIKLTYLYGLNPQKNKIR